MNEHIKKFRKLCLDATSPNDEIWDIKKQEPFFFKILEFVKYNHNCRADFVKEFIAIFYNSSVEWHIIMFCMRSLKWEEVYEYFYELNTVNNDIRTGAVLRNILEVFEDEWEDDDLYDYFREKS